MALPKTSFGQLPDEVITSILQYTPPESTINFAQTARRFKAVADEPLLWRGYCQSSYRHWDPNHNLPQKLAQDAVLTDWKRLFVNRRRIDKQALDIVDSILASQTARVEKSQKIVDLGYDAKDVLLRLCATPQDAEDVLARRYHSDALLGYFHRTLAIPEWCKIKNGEQVSLERALGAFDLFILSHGHGGLDEVGLRHTL